jgi:SHS2 domain-containing protein
MNCHWEHFHHEADIGVRGEGDTVEAAFEQCALALTAVVLDPALIDPMEELHLQCSAPDLELLLTDWLNALIYEMATRKLLFSRFHVSIRGEELSAMVRGEPMDPRRHRPAVEVKGATYTELEVRETATGSWIAQCVVDV